METWRDLVSSYIMMIAVKKRLKYTIREIIEYPEILRSFTKQDIFNLFRDGYYLEWADLKILLKNEEVVYLLIDRGCDEAGIVDDGYGYYALIYLGIADGVMHLVDKMVDTKQIFSYGLKPRELAQNQPELFDYMCAHWMNGQFWPDHVILRYGTAKNINQYLRIHEKSWYYPEFKGAAAALSANVRMAKSEREAIFKLLDYH